MKRLWYTGYDSTSLSSQAIKQAFNGSYFETNLIFYPSTPPIATMLSNLAQYDSSFKTGDIPDFGLQGSYISADLMIKGLQVAGQNPTRQSFITTSVRSPTTPLVGSCPARPASPTLAPRR